MTRAFTRTGKQVLLHGEHFADARDDVAASAIVVALNERGPLAEVYDAAHDYLHSVHRTSTWETSQRLSRALKAIEPTRPTVVHTRSSDAARAESTI